MKFEIYLSKAKFLSTPEIDALYALYTSAYQASQYPISGFWKKEHFTQISDSESFVIAKHNKDILGFIFYSRLSEEQLEIWNLSVAPTHWGKGLSDSLLDFLQHKSGEAYHEILLEVHEKNASALQLYSRNHWLITHRRKKYYQDQGDAVLMSYINRK